jgi:hypothetical protein
MPALHSDLPDFARAIVLGLDLSPNTQAFCPEYPVATALAVYRNNYFGNLHDTLAYAYPVIEQLVGKEFFRLLARQFIETHPSADGNLHHYGAQMAGFIATFEPAQSLVYLSDVAALEWACHCAYFAEDDATLDIRSLSKVPAGRYADLVLRTHPACHVVCSRYPITAIWQAHQPGANRDFHINLENGPSNALVSRQHKTVIVREMKEAEATWLQSIRSGVSVGNATAAALERDPDFDLNAALKNLVECGILINFSLDNTP